MEKKQMNKITCECGSTVAKAGIYRHRKTMKHLKVVNPTEYNKLKQEKENKKVKKVKKVKKEKPTRINCDKCGLNVRYKDKARHQRGYVCRKEQEKNKLLNNIEYKLLKENLNIIKDPKLLNRITKTIKGIEQGKEYDDNYMCSLFDSITFNKFEN